MALVNSKQLTTNFNLSSGERGAKGTRVKVARVVQTSHRSRNSRGVNAITASVPSAALQEQLSEGHFSQRSKLILWI